MTATVHGYSCGYPIPDLRTVPCVSAIPAEVYAAWYAGEGPMPVAWLAEEVYAAQLKACVMAGADWWSRSSLDDPYDNASAFYRRLPKGEREPEPVCIPCDGLGSIYYYDGPGGWEWCRRCRATGTPAAATTITTAPYRLSAEERRVVVNALSNATPRPILSWVRKAEIVVGPGFEEPKMRSGTTSSAIHVGIGWLRGGGQ